MPAWYLIKMILFSRWTDKKLPIHTAGSLLGASESHMNCRTDCIFYLRPRLLVRLPHCLHVSMFLTYSDILMNGWANCNFVSRRASSPDELMPIFSSLSGPFPGRIMPYIPDCNSWSVRHHAEWRSVAPTLCTGSAAVGVPTLWHQIEPKSHTHSGIHPIMQTKRVNI